MEEQIKLLEKALNLISSSPEDLRVLQAIQLKFIHVLGSIYLTSLDEENNLENYEQRKIASQILKEIEKREPK